MERKLNVLSLATKAEIINAARNGQSISALSYKYNVAQSTICGILKKKQQILEYANNSLLAAGNRKTLHVSGFPQMEKALHKWYLLQHSKNYKINGVVLKEKAKELHAKLSNDNSVFLASSGWLHKFKKRYGIAKEPKNSQTDLMEPCNTAAKANAGDLEIHPAENYEANESASLMALLNSWGLIELLPQLEDENIGIDELQMMKRHHLTELLHSCKLGTRIRFEYHFERWRREQNKPLLANDGGAPTISSHQHHHHQQLCMSCCPPQTQQPHQKLPTTITTATTPATSPQQAIVGRKQLESRGTNTVPVHYVDASTMTRLMLPLPTITATATTTKTLDSSASTTTSASTVIENLSSPLSPAAQLSATAAAATTSSALRPKPKAFKSTFINLAEVGVGDDIDTAPLLNILSSTLKGVSLLEYYQQHQHLKNAHRTILIQLIVNFFEMNEYHLPLKVSYNLEQQILKVFPTEKLHYYRNEKRGRIYVKFCNLKRYKRGNKPLKRKWADAGSQGGGDDGEGDGGFDDDASMGNMLPEPQVGIECDDDDDDGGDGDGDNNVVHGQFGQVLEDWHAQHSFSDVQVKTESLSDGGYC